MSAGASDRPAIEAQPEEWQQDLKEALRQAFERNLGPETRGTD